MFVQYFSEIPRPLEVLVDVLPEVLTRLGKLGEDAYREGEEIRLRIGPRSHHSATAKTVSLRADAPIQDRSSIRVPLYWEATGTSGLFPTMTADIALVQLGDQLTKIRFEGTYEPPLGALGRLLDRTLMHRIAELSVKGLVDRIVDILEVAAGRDQAGA